MSEEKPLLQEMLNLIAEAKSETLALKVVSATLLVELCLLDRNPPAKLTQLTANLQGLADTIAAKEERATSLIKALEDVASMAQAALVRQKA
jgi:hypothetical protein